MSDSTALSLARLRLAFGFDLSSIPQQSIAFLQSPASNDAAAATDHCSFDDGFERLFGSRSTRRDLRTQVAAREGAARGVALNLHPAKSWTGCDHTFTALKQRLFETPLGVRMGTREEISTCELRAEIQTALERDPLLVAFADLHARTCGEGEGIDPALAAVASVALALRTFPPRDQWQSAQFSSDGSELQKKTERCERGSMFACNDLGNLLTNGKFVPRDLQAAFSHYVRACDQELPAGCFSLAVAFRQGKGVTRDSARALDLQDSICREEGVSHSLPLACVGAAQMRALGEGVENQQEQGFADLKALCRDENELPACNDWAKALESLYDKGDSSIDLDTIRRLFEDACQQGDPFACSNLSRYLWEGLGDIEAQPERAIEWAFKVCHAGLLFACSRLAAYRAANLEAGRELDATLALSLHTCNAGDGEACAQLAEWMAARGANRNAEALHADACLAGHQESCS
ncbi:MAG: tetratricopeptide repeat protein [Acidobacteriota bacterium]